MERSILSQEKPAGYVVYVCEHLRDGVEETAKAFEKLEDALAYINHDWFAKGNHTFALFTLGKRLTLKKKRVEKPQAPVVTETYEAGDEQS